MVNIAMIGHKRIPSREGGIEIVVDELATRMAAKGHKVIAYNRKGHNVAGAELTETFILQISPLYITACVLFQCQLSKRKVWRR